MNSKMTILLLALTMAAVTAQGNTTSSSTTSGSTTDSTVTVDEAEPMVEDTSSASSTSRMERKPNAAGGSTDIKDVRTLIRDSNQYSDKTVKVSGEVNKKIDKNSFVLESGGLINNEIVVLMSPEAKKKADMVKEDEDLTVTGTLRNVGISEIRKELSWDLDPQLEMEFEGIRSYLVATDVAAKKK